MGMSREEAIKALKWFKKYNEEDYCGGDRIQDEHGDWYYRITEKDFEAFEMAITALEQEQFINKPCVSSGVCEHDKKKVLDKIRAEIENINVWGMRYEPDTYLDQRPQIVQKVKEHAIEIIDKYKAETGDNE